MLRNCFRKNTCRSSQKSLKELEIPIIGIGAGNGVDGQVLVLHDMLGMTHEFNPRFLRRYLNLYEDINQAVKNYVDDVKIKTSQMKTKNINYP